MDTRHPVELDHPATPHPPNSQSGGAEQAMKKALRLLAIRSRSCREMAGRLQDAGYSPPVVDEITERLLVVGLLDDEAFARELIRHRVTGGRSYRLIERELQERGVDKNLAECALQELEVASSQPERAHSLAARRASRCRDLPAAQATGRVARYLMGRGYPPELAWQASRQAVRQLGSEPG